MRKTFVLDTNVLLHNSNCIESFADNVVVLPMAVIEELDKFKSNNDELGRNARQVIRRLDRLRAKGQLGEGVPMENGGILKIVIDGSLPKDATLEQGITDNRIIRVARHLKTSGDRVIFVSKDINARLKSDALGIETMDFEKQKVNYDELFKGFRDVLLKTGQARDFKEGKPIKLEKEDFFPNEFIRIISAEDEKSFKGIARASADGILVPLSEASEKVWNVKPRSDEQRMALDLLMDDAVTIVTLVGQAGTGKTLLALAAGLEQTIKTKKYDKMLVSRPIMPMGKDIGFLPGDKDAKLAQWMQPIFDNLAYLMREGHESKKSVKEQVEGLLRSHVVELEALTYIRGRSIPRQYVIIDEAQNLTPHEVKTIVSRAGEGTKMVLTGDPSQIDNPYLDSNSNGLTYTAERMKAARMHGHVTLLKSERSELAAAAANLL